MYLRKQTEITEYFSVLIIKKNLLTYFYVKQGLRQIFLP